MPHDPDFKKIIFEGYSLVTVNVLYFLPDYSHVINSFCWQTLDLTPQYPRIRRFLKFWQTEIDAKIKEVVLSEMPQIPNQKWRHGIILDLD